MGVIKENYFHDFHCFFLLPAFVVSHRCSLSWSTWRFYQQNDLWDGAQKSCNSIITSKENFYEVRLSLFLEWFSFVEQSFNSFYDPSAFNLSQKLSSDSFAVKSTLHLNCMNLFYEFNCEQAGVDDWVNIYCSWHWIDYAIQGKCKWLWINRFELSVWNWNGSWKGYEEWSWVGRGVDVIKILCGMLNCRLETMDLLINSMFESFKRKRIKNVKLFLKPLQPNWLKFPPTRPH